MRKEKLNFQETLLKVLSFTLYFIISFHDLCKSWSPIYNSSWTSEVQKINKVNYD